LQILDKAKNDFENIFAYLYRVQYRTEFILRVMHQAQLLAEVESTTDH
jgi:plasmid stabilization system protein ParE